MFGPAVYILVRRPVLHIRILEFTSQLQLLIPIPAKASLWESGLDHIPGSQLLPSSATEGIWGANQKEGVLSHSHTSILFLFLPLLLPNSGKNKQNKQPVLPQSTFQDAFG